MAVKKETPETKIAIPAIDTKSFTLTVTGDTPLIVHKWSEKAKREMLEKHMKVAKSKTREAKNPVEDFIESLYWIEGHPDEYTEEAFEQALPNAKFGFPSTAFKAAAASAGYRSGLVSDKVSTYAAFHIMPELVEIIGIPHIREDMVRISKTTDVRFRAEFSEWKAILPITYNTGVYSMEQIVNLLNLGGFACGVGEWRPEKGGTHGMYHVE